MRKLGLAAVFAILAACGGSSGGGSSGDPICTSSTLGMCGEMTGTPSSTDLQSFQAQCQTLGGTAGTGTCPTANAIGKCAIPTTTAAVVYVYFYSGSTMNWTATTAQAMCVAPTTSNGFGGTWTALP